MFFFRGARGKETRHDFYFAEPASLETRHDFFFADQGPANDDSLRIPAGAEVAPVKSGQQETRHDFYLGPRQIKIMPCLDRGGTRLPGDRACFFSAGPPNFLQQGMIFGPAK